MTTTAHKKTGPRMARYRIDEPEARLPGRTLTREQATFSETHVTFLPTCSICRNYPAQLINGVWLCRGQHG